MRVAMTAAAATPARRPPPAPDRSVLHEAARVMSRVWIPAEGLVWRLGAFSFLWAVRDARGELVSGNAGSELEARKEIVATRNGGEPRGAPLLP